MNSFQRKGSFLLLLFGSAVSASCQINWKKLEPGISGGVFIYQGDLSPSALGSYKTPGININLNVQKRLNPYYSLRTNLALGKLTGSDAAYAHPGYRQQRNFQFHTPVVELSELLVWN